MVVKQPRYPKEEFARRGDEIYNRDIRPLVETEANKGKIVAMDIETGDYEIGDNALLAAKALQARRPDAQIWGVRVGHLAIHRIGPRSRTEAA